MTSSFKIHVHRNSDNIHLSLIGFFDGTSAFELINILNNQCKSAHKVFIHTSKISDVHPFGCYVFLKNFTGTHDHSRKFVITGDHKDRLTRMKVNTP